MTRVIVIGAGIGGLGCGALLARAGYEVEVFDKNPFAGGRCSATEMKGFIIDNFVHAFPLGGKGPHAAIAAELGVDLEFILQDPAAMIVDGLGGGARSYPQRLDIRPLGNRVRMARNMGVKLSNLFGVYRLFQRMLKADEEFVAAKDDMTIRDFLLEYTDDPQLHRFINVLSFMMFTVPYGRASAGEFIYCFRDMFNAANFGYVKGSSGAIPDAYRLGLENSGGRLHLGVGVQSILCEDGGVKGVLVDTGEIEGDVVVSNAGIHATVAMAGAENMGQEYVEMSRGLIYSDSAVVVKYILDEPVVEYPFVVYIPDTDAEEMFSYTCADNMPHDVYIFMPVIDLWDSSLVPEGKQLVIAGAAAPNRPSQGDSHAVIEIMERRIFSLFPGFEQHVSWREEVHAEHIQATTGHPRYADCVGLAQVPGQVGVDKPSPVTPIRGLYLVGTEAGARGIGTELAAASALAVSSLVKEGHPL
ncbi:MAG: NAD(P)/FAD-dependent oxidoreductase [Actinobacteria bacterium]|jgi:phytoene dehydrogenase-like protein|nr:MAG: NAD(P)/FAD-dependent oxidoreductase [Actinomycetota bacterium]